MKLPRSYYNTISFIGTIVAGISLLLILFLFVVAVFFDKGSSYLGLFIYIVLPMVLVIGLLMIPLGMWLNMRKSKRTGVEMEGRWNVIDLNNSRHRNALMVFSIGTIIFLLLTSIGSYEAYHYSESNKFCGTLCHKVMEPEYTTYHNSEHAHVKCVECHVGPGADWFVRAKLSGLYQVYSVLAKKYPQPIATPIHNLRPARITCEQCHWPEKFYPNRLRIERHYLADSANTRYDIDLRMLISSEHSSEGLNAGVHWHINPNVKVEYAPMEKDRGALPWVRYIDLNTGDTTVYEDVENPMGAEALAKAEIRTMDCMDCHNRPSHKYLLPQDFFDKSMAKADIPIELPEIKMITMQVFYSESFDSKEAARKIFTERINAFYEETYPDIFASKKNLIEKAINGIMDGFSKNYFPYMKANWDAYPDHIGHIEFEGCFRCHNDRHASKDGKVIKKDCNLCHTIMKQGPADAAEVAAYNGSLEFKHPVKLKDGWEKGSCAECHRYLYE
jgi:nitrate/TMAO reductase-like tetraheme cytochrome c subunit